ncbi:glutathione S-transferase family protein [Henriciella mobilis]|uniref:glutathione S-transferase family protein n=1 Tax=Henriciella mobilis TaxID=2305467 RepID=UPI000E671BDD|nr:glutathione S-transferase family protein [Henriciella mobilis]RIJ14403.1 glutathione S-transferase family protein [Henriciella mobilis]RIJ19769.1 glutathione S-transferase family protein [Henriciella mobilis]
MKLTLHAYCHSVYCWIARLALAAKGVAFEYVEINPFTDKSWTRHPFGKVPLLETPKGDLFETAALTRFVDEALPGPALMPEAPFERARVHQIVSLMDAEGCRPLVHPIAAEGYFRRRAGGRPDPATVEAGLAAAPRLLEVLETLLPRQGLAGTGQLSLADIHAAPMIDYALLAPESAGLLAPYPALADWFATVSTHDAFKATRPDLPPLDVAVS